MSSKLWQVYHWWCDSDSVTLFITNNEDDAKWYSTEYGKCYGGGEGISYTEYNPPPIINNGDRHFQAVFTFLDGGLYSVEPGTYICEYAEDDCIDILGIGGSYEEALANAAERMETIKKTREERSTKTKTKD